MSDLNSINFVLLALRIGVGLMIAAHGYNHIFGGGKIEGTASWFASMGMKHPRLQAWAASITELGAGGLLVLGLLTPLAAAALIAVMVVAWITAHRMNGFFIFHQGQGWEYVFIVTLCGLVIGALGPGDWSLDQAVGLADDTVGTTGLLIAAAGILAALGQLAVFWRPSGD